MNNDIRIMYRYFRSIGFSAIRSLVAAKLWWAAAKRGKGDKTYINSLICLSKNFTLEFCQGILKELE